MNYVLPAYGLYSALMVYIIVFVGRYFYRHGRVFILSLLQGEEELTDTINRSLLVGYCLINTGYAFLMLRTWPQVFSWGDVLGTVVAKMAPLILLLAFLHYANLTGIYLLSRKRFHHHKTPTS